jgi:hypothetical protein
MIYKGIEFSVTPAAPDIWKWQFRIGDTVKTGRTEARLSLLAIRRVQLRIDRELKRAAQDESSRASEAFGGLSSKNPVNTRG